MDRVRNEEVHRIAGIKIELASRADQRVLRWFGHVGRMEQYRMARMVFMQSEYWNTVCGAIRELPWRNIWLSDNPVEVLNEHLSLLVGRYVQTKAIRVRHKDKPWFDDQCRYAFGLKQEAHLWWTRDRSRVNWEEFVHYQVRANETYSEAKHQFSVKNRDVLMNVQSHS